MTHKEAIELSINAHIQGQTPTDLAIHVMNSVGPSAYKEDEFQSELAVLIGKRKIVQYGFRFRGNAFVLLFPEDVIFMGRI